MTMGHRKQRQESLFVASESLAKSPGHPFYKKLNALLGEAGFDRWIESRCERYYEQAETRGQPSLPPGVYFRMLLVGYFEGLDSQRGIAWRCADSLSLREFLGYCPQQPTPDASTLSRTRRRLPAEVFDEVFQFVLRIARDKKMLSGKTVGVDSTTLEANAAMKSIVRRETGEDWRAYVTRLMREEGVIAEDEEPTDDERRRYDKRRKGKKVSNDDWVSPSDPEAGITQLKDGRTHLAYKAEHVVDLKSELVLAATVHSGDTGDTTTMVDSVMEAEMNLKAAGSRETITQVAADRGYHSAAVLELCQSLGLRTYIPEPKQPHDRTWADKPDAHRRAVECNRRRTRRAKGRRLQRLRSERVERSFAHVCDTGGARRSWIRGLAEVTKRYLITVAAHNLGRILRKLFGVGKPRALGGRAQLIALLQTLITLLRLVESEIHRPSSSINFRQAPAVA
jgi:transposase